jgi:hypothetical protein
MVAMPPSMNVSREPFNDPLRVHAISLLLGKPMLDVGGEREARGSCRTCQLNDAR